MFLASKNDKPVCVKAFKTHSSSNIKRTKQQYHVQTHEMASLMAKTEFRNLQILNYFGINSPKALDYNNNFAFSMELVLYDSNVEFLEPAPLLKNVNLRENNVDPLDFLEAILDQLEKQFKEALMVHGDLSEFNILVSDNKPVIIDVSQSRLYNIKTFATTPIRIRLDDAILIFNRDLQAILNHFSKKYKTNLDIEEIYDKMFSDLPQFAKEKNILHNFTTGNKRVSKTVWMTNEEINSQTGLRHRSKDKKIQKILNDLTYD